MPPRAPSTSLTAPTPHTRVPLMVGLAVCVLFFGGLGLWSVLAPLAEAAIAPGVIKVEGSRRTIQHLEGGIVREITVRDGSRVDTGQTLMRLDDIQADAALETQRAQRWALLAQDARLAAELARARQIAFPADLLASSHPRALDAVTGQRALFEARLASLDSQLQVIEARIEQQEAVASGARGQLAAAYRQLELVRQEERMRRGLVEKGLSKLTELLAVQRAMAGIEGTVHDLESQIARAGANVAESRRQIQQALDQRQQEVSTDMRDVRSRLAETEERLRAAGDVMARRDILAPEPGTVVNLRLFTIGAVVKPGDAVMDLVPDQDQLVAEVNVQPGDIDVVHPGLECEVRLPAFKQRLVPYIRARVTWVAADVSADDQTRKQYYRAHVLLDREQLDHLPGSFLASGMPVEAHILIGERSLFRYLTQPIRDSFHRAFREQ